LCVVHTEAEEVSKNKPENFFLKKSFLVYSWKPPQLPYEQHTMVISFKQAGGRLYPPLYPPLLDNPETSGFPQVAVKAKLDGL